MDLDLYPALVVAPKAMIWLRGTSVMPNVPHGLAFGAGLGLAMVRRT